MMARVIKISVRLTVILMAVGFLIAFPELAAAEGRLFRSVPSTEGPLFKSVPPAESPEASGFTTYDISRTGNGFVWFATDRGLLRFDGEHTVSIPLDPARTGSEVVKAIAAVDGGGLMVGTDFGLYHLDISGERYHAQQLLGREPFPATCALRVPGSMTVVGGDKGLVIFDGATRKESRIMVGRDVLDLSNKVTDMSLSGNYVYLLTKGGVFRLAINDRSIEEVCGADMLKGYTGTAIGVADDKVYIGTSGNGVLRFDLSDGKLSEAFDFSKGNVVTDIEMSRDGRYMYVGTDGGGISKISLPDETQVGLARHIVNDAASPVSNQVYALYKDISHHLWVGYYQNGVDYTPSWTGPFDLMDDPAVFNTRGIPVRALNLADDRLTIGTREGLVVFERNCSTAWTVRSPALRSEIVLSLLDRNGKVLIGTYGGGLQQLDPATRTITDIRGKASDPVFTSGHIFSLAEDAAGSLWLGTSRGLFRFSADGATRRFTSSDSNLPEGNVYGIFFDSEGKGWICTDTGLCVYDPRQDKLRTDLFPSSFPDNIRYRTVYENSQGRLYFVPERGMVFSSALDLSDCRAVEHPLLEGADAKGIVEDNSGNMWIPTNRGLFRLGRDGDVRRFGLASGLPSPSFLQGQPVTDSSGHIWFGNAAGLLCLNEDDIDEIDPASYPILPTSLRINGVRSDIMPQRDAADGSFRIDLEKATNSMTIDFSTFTFAIEEPDAYLYSLDGGEWQRFSGTLSLTFYELDPGKHELRVKSANDTDDSGQITRIRISVPYPMWWYAVGLLVVALLACGVIAWRQVKRHRHKLQEVSSVMVNPAPGDNSESNAGAETAPRQKYASNALPEREASDISGRMDKIMTDEKPYLDPNLKVGDIALRVGVSSHKLSQVFSQYKGVSFYDYINAYRVEEFKSLVKDEKKLSLTLSAMAEKAGFSSRASFFRYFKNIEGMSPGEYLKKLDKDRSEGVESIK